MELSSRSTSSVEKNPIDGHFLTSDEYNDYIQMQQKVIERISYSEVVEKQLEEQKNACDTLCHENASLKDMLSDAQRALCTIESSRNIRINAWNRTSTNHISDDREKYSSRHQDIPPCNEQQQPYISPAEQSDLKSTETIAHTVSSFYADESDEIYSLNESPKSAVKISHVVVPVQENDMTLSLKKNMDTSEQSELKTDEQRSLDQHASLRIVPLPTNPVAFVEKNIAEGVLHNSEKNKEKVESQYNVEETTFEVSGDEDSNVSSECSSASKQEMENIAEILESSGKYYKHYLYIFLFLS